jgi:hypothetical protein
MFNQTFYFSTIRKYVILVGALFDDIYIRRFDADGNETELIEVPITYAPKDKMLARIMQDPGIDRPTATLPLPCISFEMGQMKYDGSRKLNTTGRTSGIMDVTNASNFLMQYNPVPYNIDFKVYIYGKNVEDVNKITEQVLPYFTPDWTTAVKIMPEMDIIMDVPVILNHVAYSDNYDKAYDQRRAIIYTLDLVVKGYFYGPIKSKPIIKFANTSFYIVSTFPPRTYNTDEGTPAIIPVVVDNIDGTSYINTEASVGRTPRSEYVIVEPGLTVNGTPTSNAAQSIPIKEIWANSDYGYIDVIVHGDGS